MSKSIEDMIASGELGVMTECAYGSSVADDELKNTLKKKEESEENNKNSEVK